MNPVACFKLSKASSTWEQLRSPLSPLLLAAVQTAGVSALQVKGNFIFDSANHRDFLGACLGTGIERSKVGDILVQGEQGASILVVPDMTAHLEMNLTSVCPADNCITVRIDNMLHVNSCEVSTKQPFANIAAIHTAGNHKQAHSAHVAAYHIADVCVTRHTAASYTAVTHIASHIAAMKQPHSNNPVVAVP